MGKAVDDTVLDAALDETATCNEMTLWSQQPTNRTEAVTTYMLATTPMTPGNGNDYTIADGVTSGRRVTMAQKTDVNVTNSGTGDHVALVTATELKLVTTCAAQAVTSGNQVTFNSWDQEIADPT